MSAGLSADVTLLEAMRTLAMLGDDDAAKRGLRAVISAGRRHGLDTVQIAGVTITSSKPKETGPRHGGRGGGVSGGQRSADQAPSKRKRRGKPSVARQARDAERRRAKKMKHKLLAVLPIVSRVMSAHAQQDQELQDVLEDDAAGHRQRGGSGTESTRSSPAPSDAGSFYTTPWCPGFINKNRLTPP